MKQRVTLMVMILMAVLNTTYAQYPVVKKIGKDSVILITVKQGEEINNQFDQNQKHIKELKDSLQIAQAKRDSLKANFHSYMTGSSQRLQKMYESYYFEYNQRKLDSLKFAQKEDINRKSLRHLMFFSTALTVMLAMFGIFGK